MRTTAQFCLTLIVVLIGVLTTYIPAASPSDNTAPWKTINTFHYQISQWIPFLKHESFSKLTIVDPSKILISMITNGGLFLPREIEQELNDLAQICHVDEAKLDIINRRLVLYNFTVSLPKLMKTSTFQQQQSSESNPPLTIGRVDLRWDSYINPCLFLQVENVSIVVEFTNILLTQNNWNELRDAGFPPKLLFYDDDEKNKGSSPLPPISSVSSSSFIRIGGIDLVGKAVVEIRSRILQKPITEDLVLELDAWKELSSEISKASSNPKKKDDNGRPGCTTEELYKIIELYFSKKLKYLAATVLVDLVESTTSKGDKQATTTSILASKMKKITSNIQNTFSTYTRDVGETLQTQMEEYLEAELPIVGFLPNEIVEKLKGFSRSAIGSASDGTFFRSLQEIHKKHSHLNDNEQQGQPANNPDYKVEGFPDKDIMFSDW